jgi:hypothetical protein
VVIKVEVSDQGVTTRFVVTDMEDARTKGLYQHIYCARGKAENESKDHLTMFMTDFNSYLPTSAVSCCWEHIAKPPDDSQTPSAPCRASSLYDL